MHKDLYNRIFSIDSDSDFNTLALEIFRYQYENNPVYNEYVSILGRPVEKINNIRDIPFLPIDFFRTKKVLTGSDNVQAVFMSSGTTGQEHSKHYVSDIQLYKKSFRKCFEYYYGDIKDYCILALLPSYMEQKNSSLVFMMDDLIKNSGHPDSSFYLHDTGSLVDKIREPEGKKQKTILFGVSFALLDLAEAHDPELHDAIVMETGGMKGRRKEMTRKELHGILKKGFGVSEIHSEYGMTELLSQAYSKGNGIFYTPPWMKVFIRDIYDPFSRVENGKTGGINVIDLANINSCSFIETMDLGSIASDGGFEVLGRYDNSIIRGCNQMI